MNFGSSEAVTMTALSSALDMAMLRQQVIAANIANANTPGYAAKRVSFSDVFDNQIESANPHGATAIVESAIVEPAVDAAGQPLPVQLDEEVAAMAQNALQYQTLLRGVSRYFSILGSAISEGRR